jgi:hypothetical protein
MEQGIYFIANDNTFDLAVAFLNSLRTFEPLIPACLIPYDTHIRNIIDLKHRYNFTVWDDDAELLWCDAISERFHGRSCGHYRKLAIWNGPYQRFIYIDIDTVVLSGLELPFTLLDDYDILAATSDNPVNRKFVWKDSLPCEAREFDSGYAANTGVLLSKRQMLTRRAIDQSIEPALNYAHHMELTCAEQAFLNYLIVTSGKRYSSLRTIARETNRKDIPLHIWSGGFNGDLLQLDRVPLVIHWAGEWQRGEHLRSPVWNYFRQLRGDCQSACERSPPSPAPESAPAYAIKNS